MRPNDPSSIGPSSHNDWHFFTPAIPRNSAGEYKWIHVETNTVRHYNHFIATGKAHPPSAACEWRQQNSHVGSRFISIHLWRSDVEILKRIALIGLEWLTRYRSDRTLNATMLPPSRARSVLVSQECPHN
ncbi:hypothetical protein GCM10009543_19650 [Leifsonia naganoensis]